jgi:hypothetical protein
MISKITGCTPASKMTVKHFCSRQCSRRFRQRSGFEDMAIPKGWRGEESSDMLKPTGVRSGCLASIEFCRFGGSGVSPGRGFVIVSEKRGGTRHSLSIAETTYSVEG